MSRYGEFLNLTIFGQSHAPAIGMILEGLPAGETIDMAALQTFWTAIAPGATIGPPLPGRTSRNFFPVWWETSPAAATAIIRNTSTPLRGLLSLSVVPRPVRGLYRRIGGGHADFTGGGSVPG